MKNFTKCNKSEKEFLFDSNVLERALVVCWIERRRICRLAPRTLGIHLGSRRKLGRCTKLQKNN
jgi:hypothetical protein